MEDTRNVTTSRCVNRDAHRVYSIPGKVMPGDYEAKLD